MLTCVSELNIVRTNLCLLKYHRWSGCVVFRWKSSRSTWPQLLLLYAPETVPDPWFATGLVCQIFAGTLSDSDRCAATADGKLVCTLCGCGISVDNLMIYVRDSSTSAVIVTVCI